MKPLGTRVGLFLAFFAVTSLVPCVVAKSISAFPSSLNVRDFGAVGDGVADDTKALQAAADEALRIEKERRVQVGNWRGVDRGTKGSRSVEIFFPAGTYAISDVIVFQQSAVLRGEDGASIRQQNPQKDVFYFHYAFRYFVENLRFVGGRIQLKFWTGNIWSRIFVKNCTFVDSLDYAIECLSFTEQRMQGEQWNRSRPWPPYVVEEVNGSFTGRPNTSNSLVEWYNSTLLIIESSVFENCMKAVTVACDTTLIRNCVITTNPNMEGAAFHLSGQTRVYGLKGMAKTNPKRKQAWMEGDGNVSLRDIELETDSKEGWCLFRSSILPRATTRGLRVENVRVKSVGCPEGAIVWIGKNTLPSILSLEGITETSGDPVDLVVWEEIPNAETLSGLKQFPSLSLPEQFSISVGKLSENIRFSLPEIFQELQQDAIPETILALFRIPEQESAEVESKDFDIIYAEELGVKRDSSIDQYEALQHVFDKAKTYANPLVVFPGGSSYITTQPIQLPDTVSIRVVGTSQFVQQNPDKDLFIAPKAKRLNFINCDFSGGKTGVAISTDPNTEARVEFTHCSFFDQTDAAISAWSLSDGKEAANRTSLFVNAAIFRTNRALVTNANFSRLSGFWAFNDPHLSDQAFIENRGGTMLVEGMLGNPVLWAGKRAKVIKGITDWPYSNKLRWVDNWGTLIARDNRYGGESGGMCNIYNRSPEGRVYVNGGMSRYANTASHLAIVFAEEVPKLTVLRDISSVPIRVEGVSARIMGQDKKPLDEKKHPVYVSGVLAP